MRKLIAVLLLCSAVFTVFAEGTKEQSPKPPAAKFRKEGYPIVDEPITLRMYGPKAAIQAQWADMLFFKEMQKLTNITFTFETPAAGDSFRERTNILFASGDLPDVFFGAGFSSEDLFRFGSQGSLLALDGLIDSYMPNMKKFMAENNQIKKTITSSNGKIYSLPNINEVFFDLTHRSWIRKEWLDKLGLKLPETTEDLYRILVAFRDKDPNGNGKNDEIPLTSVKADRLRPAMLAAFGIRWVNGYPYFADDGKGKISYIPAMPGYKAYVEYMNRLYKEKLLDNNLFTNTDQELAVIGKEQRLGAYSHAAAFLYNDYDKNELYAALPPMTSPTNSKKTWPRLSGVVPGVTALSSKNAYPEASIRWMDYLYSVEGSMLVDQGVEGVSWKWLNQDKKLWEKVLPAGMTNTEEFRASVTPAAGGLLSYARLNFWLGKLNSPHALVLVREVGEKYTPHWDFVVPNLSLLESDQKRATAILADLNPYIEQMEAKFIIGAESLAGWDKYIGVLQQMGMKELTDIYQRAYDQFNR